MRVVFMGTGDIGLPTLDFLLSHPRHELVGLVTQPDKPAGRKLILTPPKVKLRALERSLPTYQPERIRQVSALEPIEKWRPDLIVVMAYGQILPKALIDLPTMACLNLHASLLPRHRGAAPIQAAIRAGDSESGISVMHVDVGLDMGDVILHKATPLAHDETGQSLHDRLAQLAPTALDEALTLLESGSAPRQPQDETLATYARQLTREDGRIDWSCPALEIERTIRAYHPWPGCHSLLGAQSTRPLQLKIFPPTEVIPGRCEAPPGSIVESGGGFVVATGTGCLRLRQVQLEGRKAMSAEAFLSGHRLPVGAVLGSVSGL